jgi:fumarylpyruvate hydrolase
MNELKIQVPTAPPSVSVAVDGSSQRFSVRRVYCVGRNYADHIKEMGGDERDPPFFFQKPTDAVVGHNARIPYPLMTNDFQYEVELVLAIGLGGEKIPPTEAVWHVWGLAVGIDLTRRDLQLISRNTGRPWEIGKSFDYSAPCGDISPLKGSLPMMERIELRVNEQLRQSGNLGQMIWSCAEIVSKLSMQYCLQPGDLIFTGTPSGVGSLSIGDTLRAAIDGLPELEVSIVNSTAAHDDCTRLKK